MNYMYKFKARNEIGDFNTYSENGEVICPYCGYIHTKDSFELPDKMEFDHISCECANCCRKFYLGQTITISNETYKDDSF